MHYFEEEVNRLTPESVKVSSLLVSRPESFVQVSGGISLRDALLEFRNAAAIDLSRRFSAVLVALNEGKLGIITVATLAELVISGDISYDLTLSEICEPLDIIPKDEEFGRVRKANFGIADEHGNLIAISRNPIYNNASFGGNYELTICG